MKLILKEESIASRSIIYFVTTVKWTLLIQLACNDKLNFAYRWSTVSFSCDGICLLQMLYFEGDVESSGLPHLEFDSCW